MKDTLLAALEAGAAQLTHYFHQPLRIDKKEGVNNLVTEADTAAEAAIMRVIQDAHPDHFILSEEFGEHSTNSSHKWIIDPIDGTVNFANQIPLCCVSIALEVDGKMVLGGVYNPFLNELFLAERGQGATCNGKSIHVSSKTDVNSCCLVTGFPYTYLDSENGPLQVFERFIRKGIAMRRLGSAAIDLCWVAAGKFDGFYEHKLQAWDSAAGFLIVEEAGGTVTDFSGAPYSVYQPHLLATNGRIHTDMLDIIHGRKQL